MAVEMSAAVVHVLLPAVSRKWPVDLILFVLGGPLLVTDDDAERSVRRLIHSSHDHRIVVEVAGHEVTAALLTVRTRAADAHAVALASLSELLGPPRRGGSHAAWWSSDGVDVRLAGWRGEFNVEVRAR